MHEAAWFTSGPWSASHGHLPQIDVNDVKALAWRSTNGRAKLGVVRQPSLRLVLPVGSNNGGLVREHLLQAGRVGKTHDVHEESPCLQPCRQVVDASTNNGLGSSTFHHLQRPAATAELQLNLAWIRGGNNVSIGQQLGGIYKVTLQYFLSYSLGKGEINSVGRLRQRLSSRSRGSDGGQHWSDRLRQGNGDGGMYFLPHKLAQIVIPAPVWDLGSRSEAAATLSRYCSCSCSCRKDGVADGDRGSRAADLDVSWILSSKRARSSGFVPLEFSPRLSSSAPKSDTFIRRAPEVDNMFVVQ